MRSILIAVLFLNIGLAIVSSVFCKKNRAHEEQKIEAMMRAPVEKEPREGPLCEEKIMRMESMLREAKEKSGEQVPEEYMPTVQKGPFEDKLNNPTSYYEKGHLVYKMVIPYDEYIDKDAYNSTDSIKNLRKKILQEFKLMSGSSREALIVDFKGFEEEYFRYKVKVYQMAQLPPLMKKHGQNLFLGGLDGVYVYFHNDMEGMSIYLDISPSVRSEL